MTETEITLSEARQHLHDAQEALGLDPKSGAFYAEVPRPDSAYHVGSAQISTALSLIAIGALLTEILDELRAARRRGDEK
ncbi:MAG TPA: hypothetical protein VKP64_05925 [Mycobacteriales bacterium]|nr:hypothetical protein [Mycobacteriales bacterium]